MSVSYTHLDVYKRQASYIGTREWHFVDIPLSTSGDKDFVETQEEKICPITDLKGGVASVGAPAQDCVCLLYTSRCV